MESFLCIRPRKLGLLLAVMLSVPACTAADVTLAWDPSPDTNVVAYRVYYGPTAGLFASMMQVAAPATTAVVGSLVSGATYYFAAKAVNGAGAESDYSNQATFSTIVATNFPPTLNPVSNVVINEDAGAQTIALCGITSGAANEIQPLTVTATSSNPGLIPNPTVSYTSPNAMGTLTFAPVANAFGTATITVNVSDGQTGNSFVLRTFTVTVNAVNDAPTLNAIANMTIDSSAGTKSVTLSGISSGAANENQLLIVTATSSNPLLIAAPTVAYASPISTATLTLAPVLNQTGTATITVTVSDGQLANSVTTRSFNVTLSSLPKLSGVTAEALDARTMRVSWNTDRTATCALEYGLTANVDQVSASTSGTSHSVTLTNLTPGTVYYLQVRATTSGGAATAVATAATEGRQVFQWAAENGALSGPIKIFASTETANGKYVASSTKNKGGNAAFTLNLPRGRDYRMWARVKTSVGGGTFTVSTDSGADKAVFVEDANATNAWHWALVMDGVNRTNVATLPIEAGAHTLTMKGALTAAWDEFLIANDSLWQPILPTTRPVLTAARTSAQSAVLNWSDPSGNATSVSIEYSTDGVNFQPFTGVAASQKTATLGGLSPQTYYFRVFSYNSLDRTAHSNVAAAIY